MLSRIIITMATCLFFVVGFASTASAQCPEGHTVCGNGCAMTRTDDNHCGGCNKKCERYETCAESRCVLVCPDKQLTCGDVCVTAASDPNHCGGCGRRCPDGAYCSAGQCKQAVCPGVKPVAVSSTTRSSNSTMTTKKKGKKKPKPQTKKHTYKKTNPNKAKAR